MSEQQKPSKLRAMSSALTQVSRLAISRLLGLQMNGNRDLYNTFGWNSNPTYNEFCFKYRRQDIAKRIVNAPVSALWSDPPEITGDPDFTAAWNQLLADIPVFSALTKLDKLAGLGRYAILVVGTDDASKLETPLNPKEGRKVIYLQAYGEGSAEIAQYDESTTSKRFGLPLMYQVNPGAFDVLGQKNRQTVTSVVTRSSFKVHWTRVLHVAENALETDVIGTSRLEAVYNDLDDLLKVCGGAAEMFWLAGNRGLHINVDKDMEMDQKDADNLAEEVEEYEDNLSRVIRTRGVEVKPLGSQTVDPSNTFDVILSLISCATGIPKRELMGSEAGQLASQQDRANWAQRVAERISEYGQPTVLLPFLRLLIDMGVLPAPKSLTVDWPDAFKMNPLERAQTSAQMARSAANLAKTLKTVADINHQNAVDSRPTVTPVGGGGFFGNASDPSQSSSQKDPAMQNDQQQQGTIEQPALYDKPPPKLTLLTEEECRRIIGFGKHPPVFDKGNESASQTPPTQDASTTATAPGE